MSMSALPAWSERSEQDAPSSGADSGDPQHDARTRNAGSPWLILAPLGAAAVAAAVLLPEAGRAQGVRRRRARSGGT